MSEPPFPPLDLIGRVGVEEDPDGQARLAFFDESGRRSRQDILSALPEDWAWRGKAALDFGCGSGRVLRHFTEEAESCEFWACDIDERSIDWIDDQLVPPFRAYACGERPPLPHESGSLDLIYAVSVFSHLAPGWAEWACELHRLLRTGGLLVITTLGRGDWPDGIAGQRGVPFEEDRIGLHVEHFGSRFDDSWGPAVYVSEWWFREHWGRAFDVLRFCPSGFAGTPEDKRAGAGQAWAVLRRATGRAPSPAELVEPRRGDPRELESALHSRDLAYAEIADLRAGELRRLNRDWQAHQERIRELETGLATVDRQRYDAPGRPAVGSGAMVPLPPPLAGLRERLRSIASSAADTRQRVIDSHAALSEQLGDLRTAMDSRVIDSQSVLIDELGKLRGATDAGAPAEPDGTREMLLAIADREPVQRQRLWELRAEPGYGLAFTEPEPLVTIVIPTYDNHHLLGERSIPSVLAQTYQNFEVVVVGDGAPDEARAVVEGLGDPRFHFHNRPYRGPYPDDPRARWLVAGVPPFNDAVRRATGRWIAPLDDDDAFRPDHLEVLVGLAQRERLELAYGRAQIHSPEGGGEEVIGRFPPVQGHLALQMAIYHAGLASIFELELADAAFAIPSDWGLFRRMLRAGVRAGMDDRVVVDGYPSGLWMRREGASAPPSRSGDQMAGDGRPEWEYVPEGWRRAENPEEPCARGWDVEPVAQAYADNWPAFLSVLEGTGPLGVGYEAPAGVEIGNTSLIDQNLILCFGLSLARAAGGRERLKVLDWGGALGHYHALARRLLPGVELDYHVRELPAVVAQGRRLNPDVTFHDTDDCFEDAYDFVLVSGSLPYVAEWREKLVSLAQATRGKLLISRLGVVSQRESFVVIQRAQAYGYATEYLGWVLNRGELARTAEGAGLELEQEFLVHDPFEIRGAPEVVHHRGFLYAGGAATTPG